MMGIVIESNNKKTLGKLLNDLMNRNMCGIFMKTSANATCYGQRCANILSSVNIVPSRCGHKASPIIYLSLFIGNKN